MDLIFTDAQAADVGVLKTYDFDLSYGAAENDFELVVPSDDAQLEYGSFVYAEGVEYGGIVGGIKASTDGQTVSYTGRTWHGLLNSKVILPLKDGEQVSGKLRRLPHGYTELDYIETTGTQYINTGFIPNQDTRIVCEFLYKGGNGIYGARNTVATRNFSMRAISGYWQMGYGDGAASGTIRSDTTNWHIADQNKNSLYIDGQLAVTREYVTFSAPRPAAIGAIRAGSVYYGLGRYRDCQIYDNGVMVRDLIPCMNPDGEIGMYDRCGKTFYGNAGTDVFIAGAAIATVDVVIPDSNGEESLIDAHLIISGEANDCLRWLAERLGATGLFSVSLDDSGVAVDGYQFNRYCKGYDGIRTMLAANGGKLHIEWKDKVVQLSAVPLVDYTKAPIDGDIAALTVEQHKHKVNHLICLGKGDLAEREVVHLYADANGVIGDTQYYTGLDEVTEIYENTSTEDLRGEATKKFKEIRDTDKAEISLPESQGRIYDIGDIVGATEYKTGLSVAADVTQKIVKIYNGVVKTDYKTGG